MELLKVSQVAEILKVNPQTIYRHIKAGYFPYVKVGRSIRFSSDAVKQFINDNTRIE